MQHNLSPEKIKYFFLDYKVKCDMLKLLIKIIRSLSGIEVISFIYQVILIACLINLLIEILYRLRKLINKYLIKIIQDN